MEEIAQAELQQLKLTLRKISGFLYIHMSRIGMEYRNYIIYKAFRYSYVWLVPLLGTCVYY
jgi:hypothetical protein